MLASVRDWSAKEWEEGLKIGFCSKNTHTHTKTVTQRPIFLNDFESITDYSLQYDMSITVLPTHDWHARGYLIALPNYLKWIRQESLNYVIVITSTSSYQYCKKNKEGKNKRENKRKGKELIKESLKSK